MGMVIVLKHSILDLNFLQSTIYISVKCTHFANSYKFAVNKISLYFIASHKTITTSN